MQKAVGDECSLLVFTILVPVPGAIDIGAPGRSEVHRRRRLRWDGSTRLLHRLGEQPVSVRGHRRSQIGETPEMPGGCAVRDAGASGHRSQGQRLDALLVEKIERGPVPPSVFALPEGYKRVKGSAGAQP